MKTLLTVIFVFFVSVLISQTVKYRMTDFAYFKYPVEQTLKESLSSNTIEYDSVSYSCNTVYTIDMTNGIFSYVVYNESEEKFKIKNYIEKEKSLSVEVFITNKGLYHYWFTENDDGNTSLIVREVVEKDGKVSGFYTNKVELVN